MSISWKQICGLHRKRPDLSILCLELLMRDTFVLQEGLLNNDIVNFAYTRVNKKNSEMSEYGILYTRYGKW